MCRSKVRPVVVICVNASDHGLEVSWARGALLFGFRLEIQMLEWFQSLHSVHRYFNGCVDEIGGLVTCVVFVVKETDLA